MVWEPKIGDEVFLDFEKLKKNNYYDNDFVADGMFDGMRGTVCDLSYLYFDVFDNSNNLHEVGVCWDAESKYVFHDCGGRCEDHHGWYVPIDCLYQSMGIEENYASIDMDSMLDILGGEPNGIQCW